MSTTIYRPDNKELEELESILDDLVNLFDGSDLFDRLNSTYSDLDSIITELKDKCDELHDKKVELEERIEELETNGE